MCDLFARNAPGLKNVERYCYLLADGTQSPTLRLNPGDLLILKLHNELGHWRALRARTPSTQHADGAADPCNSGAMTRDLDQSAFSRPDRAAAAATRTKC